MVRYETPAGTHWCIVCIKDGRAEPAYHYCPKCNRHACPAHVLTDPHYVPADTETLDLFGPEPDLTGGPS